MKRFGLGAISALALAGAVAPALVPATVPAARAQSFAASAPLVQGAGVAGARGTSHFIEVSVNGFSLSGLNVECTNLAGVSSVDITDQFGNTIANTISVSEGSDGGSAVAISFAQDVPPGTMLRLVMNDIERQLDGGNMFYRVTAETPAVDYSFPVGTAFLIESPVGDR